MGTGRSIVAGALGGAVIWMVASTAPAQETSRGVEEKSGVTSVTSVAKSDAQPKQPPMRFGQLAKHQTPRSDGPRRSWLGRDFVEDQKQIWTSPARFRWSDANWLVPLGGATAGLFAIDHEVGRRLSDSPGRLKLSCDISNYGVGSLIGAAGGLYLWGKMTHDDHRRETGLLSAEALLNTIAVASAFQRMTGRERPFVNGAAGSFGQGGTSFPSDHSAAAWSVASVIAHEYPGPLTKLLAYGMATAVSVSRVSGKQHFPSDVFVGGVAGWLIGQQVYRAHHDPELGGGGWGFPLGARDAESGLGTHSVGSPYVPLDSWVYSAFDRLASFSYVKTALIGARPWTRTECARLTQEARESLTDAASEDHGPDKLALEYQAALEREFAYELEVWGGRRNRVLRVESVYTRMTSISGPPLTDGFHFGQTISYDFGRPFRRGANVIAGSSVSGSYGPFFLYVRGEFQHAPSAPALSDAVRNVVATRDFRPLEAAHPLEAINLPTLLDAYVGMNFGNLQLSFGKQSLQWGPGTDGGLLFSRNAEPLYMVRLTNVRPLELPSFLRYFGPVRIENIVAQPRGRTLIPMPYIYGQKFILKPLPFLEIGFSRTITLGGQGGNPVTAGNFFRSYFGREGKLPGPGTPGDSRSAFDWTLRVPGLQGRLVVYSDMFADDDELPLVNPSRSTFRPGLWLTRVPWVAKLDLRVEVTSSESPGFRDNHGNLNYFNGTYRDGYTNNGFLIGNTVGRQGTAVQVSSTYRFSATSYIQLGFKNSTVDPEFIPGGGHWQDYSVGHEKWLKSGFYVKSFLQVENIRNYPILFDGSRKNVTASIEIGFAPERRIN